MAKGMAGASWRRPLAALIVTSSATLAWTKVRRRQLPGSMPRSWSKLAPSPPTSLRPAAAQPVTAPEAAEPVTAPEMTELVAAPEMTEPVAVPEMTEPVTAPEMTEPVAVPEAPEPIAAPAAAGPAGDGPVPGPYPGSVLPLADGSAPSEEYVIKGNAGSMRSHAAGSPYFGRTRAQVWFRTQEDAAAAGFAPWTPKR